MVYQKLTLLSVFLIVLIFSLGCTGNRNLSSTLKAYLDDGYINFDFKVNLKQLEKLRDQLAIGNADACFVYRHSTVFKDFTEKYDSISYSCRGDKILDSNVLERFGERFNMKFVNKEEAVIKYEPFHGMIQFTIEVGENPRGQENRIYFGYSKKGTGLRPIRSYQ
ncbi:MAG: hypothetical protein HRU41_23710 [Saprospiraceae bacterium]|nr:hypothetical protein [Saprospiraceae bacterium]